jgi:excisionase family DNA binding protein
MQQDNIERKRTRRYKDFMSPRQIADRSGIGLLGVYALLKSGHLPAVRVGKRYYIPVSAYEAYLENWGSANSKPPQNAA